jgi:leader peptidase (prepilin peptidase)/N-methyltransferase
MPAIQGDLARRVLGSDGWLWAGGQVAVYLAPACLAGRAGLPPTQVLLLSLLLAAALITLSEIDRTTFRLPDALTIPLALAGLSAAAVMGTGLLWHAVSAGIGFIAIVIVDHAYRAWRGVSGIGLGDAKLLAASGAWLGAEALLSVLFWSCLAALLVLLVARMRGRRLEAQTLIPFGSFLAFGTWLVWCLGPLQ